MSQLTLAPNSPHDPQRERRAAPHEEPFVDSLRNIPASYRRRFSAEGLRRAAPWVLPPSAMLVVALVAVRRFDLDLRVSAAFFDPETGHWPEFHDVLWTALYHYSYLPALVIGISAFVASVVSPSRPKLCAWREPGLFLGLLLLLGPGLMVNLIGKPGFARPRPNGVAEFGGADRFVRVGEINSAGSGRSFPSGHAATGFYMLAPAFILYRRRRGWAWGCGLLGLAYGAVIGYARVAQGQHFLSDVIGSLGIIYFVALALSPILDAAPPASTTVDDRLRAAA